jgi:hypothetical protein
MIWITAALWADSTAGLTQQRWLGVGTWLLLAVLLAGSSALVRAQVGVVVATATLVEYIFSDWLSVYAYRLDNVPAFVPPGHGLVYLGAVSVGRVLMTGGRARWLPTLTITAAGMYAMWGLWWSSRPDVLGAFWGLCLAGFLLFGRSPSLYIGACLVVTYLELTGTALGTWTWSSRDPTGLVAIGNPPSVAAGGYGWFDLYATLLAPTLVRFFRFWVRPTGAAPRRGAARW